MTTLSVFGAFLFAILVFGFLGILFRAFWRLRHLARRDDMAVWRLKHGSPVDGLCGWQQGILSCFFEPLWAMGFLVTSILFGGPLVLAAAREIEAAHVERFAAMGMATAWFGGLLIGRFAFPLARKK